MRSLITALDKYVSLIEARGFNQARHKDTKTGFALTADIFSND